jgi:ApbE superfamily uncharacterized protein (UPF0280 family)
MNPAISERLRDGRLHLQHGPIDVLIECWGERAEIDAACDQARERFQSLLGELVGELPRLRQPVGETYPLLRGTVARRMVAAVWPCREVFVTPMAAVAGAVADELMTSLLKDRKLRKACVNDGGDIALYVAPDEEIEIGVVADISRPAMTARTSVGFSSPARGVATSGWRGRSQSLGIADAVTILAHNAAAADAAATLVANAVNIDHPAIERRPACQVKEDSDLGELPVTVAVGPLPLHEKRAALANGLATARRLQERGLIHAAYLALQGATAVVPAADAFKLREATASIRRPAP